MNDDWLAQELKALLAIVGAIKHLSPSSWSAGALLPNHQWLTVSLHPPPPPPESR